MFVWFNTKHDRVLLIWKYVAFSTVIGYVCCLMLLESLDASNSVCRYGLFLADATIMLYVLTLCTSVFVAAV